MFFNLILPAETRKNQKKYGDGPLCDPYFGCFWHLTYPLFRDLWPQKRKNVLIETQKDTEKINRDSHFREKKGGIQMRDPNGDTDRHRKIDRNSRSSLLTLS